MYFIVFYPLVMSFVMAYLLFLSGVMHLTDLFCIKSQIPFLVQRFGLLDIFYTEIMCLALFVFVIVLCVAVFFTLRFEEWGKNIFLLQMFLWLAVGVWSLLEKFSSEEVKVGVGHFFLTAVLYVLPSLLGFFYFTHPDVKDRF
jgi:hypothetical protein